MRPLRGTWIALQFQCPWKKKSCLSFSYPSVSNNFLDKSGTSWTLHMYVGIMAGLILCESYPCMSSCCEIIYATTLSYLESAISLQTSTRVGSKTFCSVFQDDPGVWKESTCDRDALFLSEHCPIFIWELSIISYSLLVDGLLSIRLASKQVYKPFSWLVIDVEGFIHVKDIITRGISESKLREPRVSAQEAPFLHDFCFNSFILTRLLAAMDCDLRVLRWNKALSSKLILVICFNHSNETPH